MDSGYPGMPYRLQEFTITFTGGGVPMKMYVAAGVVNYSFYGWNPSWDAMAVYHVAPTKDWPQSSQWLPVIGNSVVITNLTGVAGNKNIIPARNNPLENPLIESWRLRGLSQDRISEAQRNGMMGYQRMVSTSGQEFTMPLEEYNSGIGGF